MAQNQILVAVTSMTTTRDRAANLKQAERLVRDAAKSGAGWVVLPEMFVYQGPYDTLYEEAEPFHGPAWQMMSGLAKELGIVLFGGSIAERPDKSPSERKVYNVAYVFGRDGGEIACYRKVHLFNLKTPDGKPLYCESDGYLSGDEAVVLEVDGFKVAMAVLNNGRTGLGGGCVGAMKRLIEHATSQASQRKQFGKSISEFQLMGGDFILSHFTPFGSFAIVLLPMYIIYVSYITDRVVGFYAPLLAFPLSVLSIKASPQVYWNYVFILFFVIWLTSSVKRFTLLRASSL